MIPFNTDVRRLFKLSSIGEPVRSFVPLQCVVYQYIDYQLLQSGKKEPIQFTTHIFFHVKSSSSSSSTINFVVTDGSKTKSLP